MKDEQFEQLKKEVRQEERIKELKQDIEDIKESGSQKGGSVSREIWDKIKKNRLPLLLLLLSAIGIYSYFNVNIEIPEIAYIIALGFVFGSIISYVPAKRLANRFVPETRRPIIEMNPYNWDGIRIYMIPVDRVSDIQVYDGEMHPIQTKYGEGYEVERFYRFDKGGRTYLAAKGTWYGREPLSNIKRYEKKIEKVDKELKPEVDRALMYDQMWEFIGLKIRRIVVNDFTKMFEKSGMSSIGNIQSNIDELMEEYDPRKMQKNDFAEHIEEIEQNDQLDIELEQLETTDTMENGEME